MLATSPSDFMIFVTGQLFEAIRVTNIMKPLGPIELVVDVVIFIIYIIVLKPKWFHDICDPDSFSKPSGSQIS